ncbi:hypothetical protein APHAL10511_003563 [Amanita phalloides]|nr:hypothetical protein APHAL10511_003563 [Amanita phalloides]
MQKLRLGFAIVALALFKEAAATVSTNTSDNLVYDDRQVHARTWVLPSPTKRHYTGRNGITKRHPADSPPAAHQPHHPPVATLELFRSNKGYWMTNIEIGTHRPGHPQQFFRVILDTGASRLWVTSSKMPNPGTSKTYDPSLSSSSTDLHSPFESSYEVGVCEGPSYSDIVNVGGLKVRMSFGSVTKRDPDMEEGILGLNLVRAPVPQNHFFQAVQGTPAYRHFNPIAAFCFGTNDLGELYLGHVKDSAYLGGKIEYHPVVQLSELKDTWAIGSGEMSIGGVTIPGIRTILDTGGGSMITGPPGEVKKIYDKIPDSQYYREVYGHAIVGDFIGPENSGGLMQDNSLAVELPGEKYWCKGAIQGKMVSYDKNPETLWLLGDVFTRGKGVIYDARNRRVGLAKAKDKCGK